MCWVLVALLPSCPTILSEVSNLVCDSRPNVLVSLAHSQAEGQRSKLKRDTEAGGVGGKAGRESASRHKPGMALRESLMSGAQVRRIHRQVEREEHNKMKPPSAETLRCASRT